MTAHSTADLIAGPLGELGASFYFSPQAVEVGQGLGLDVVSFYGSGRGGVLGDIDPAEVDKIFFFFKSGMIQGLVERGRAVASLEDIVPAHMEAARRYALTTFGDVDDAVLEAFSDAAVAVLDAAPVGRWPIVDGYRSQAVPSETASRAYFYVILLRELRGGVHTDAVVAQGLTGAIACQFDRGDDYYRLHGFGDDDRVEGTDEILASRKRAEEATTAEMASLLETLSASQLEALETGVVAMKVASSNPKPAA